MGRRLHESQGRGAFGRRGPNGDTQPSNGMGWIGDSSAEANRGVQPGLLNKNSGRRIYF